MEAALPQHTSRGGLCVAGVITRKLHTTIGTEAEVSPVAVGGFLLPLFSKIWGSAPLTTALTELITTANTAKKIASGLPKRSKQLIGLSHPPLSPIGIGTPNTLSATGYPLCQANQGGCCCCSRHDYSKVTRCRGLVTAKIQYSDSAVCL